MLWDVAGLKRFEASILPAMHSSDVLPITNMFLYHNYVYSQCKLIHPMWQLLNAKCSYEEVLYAYSGPSNFSNPNAVYMC